MSKPMTPEEEPAFYSRKTRSHKGQRAEGVVCS